MKHVSLQSWDSFLSIDGIQQWSVPAVHCCSFQIQIPKVTCRGLSPDQSWCDRLFTWAEADANLRAVQTLRLLKPRPNNQQPCRPLSSCLNSEHSKSWSSQSSRRRRRQRAFKLLFVIKKSVKGRVEVKLSSDRPRNPSGARRIVRKTNQWASWKSFLCLHHRIQRQTLAEEHKRSRGLRQLK